MKGLLGLLTRSSSPDHWEAQDSQLFTPAFADQGIEPYMLVP